MTKLILAISLVLFVSLMTCFVYLINLIPKPANMILNGLFYILYFILIVLSSVLSSFVIFIIFGKIFKKVSCNLTQVKKEYIAKSCEVLRTYYGLKDNYLVTKCFKCTNSKFNNHDVCIFKVDDEIRITTDIIHGFINYSKDFGCYCFHFDKIEIIKMNLEEKRVTRLKDENFEFILGIKSFSYIMKRFSK